MEKPPQKSESRQAVEDTVVALANFLPHFGGALSASLSSYLNREHSKKMNIWFEQLAISLTKLEKDFEKLACDWEFRDTFAAAARSAEIISGEEKLEALKNAVKNSIDSLRPAEEKRIRFIRFVELMVPEHILLLKAHRVDMGGGQFDVFAGMNNRDYEMEERLRVDLDEWKLMSFESVEVNSGQHIWRGNITDFGFEFIKFIS